MTALRQLQDIEKISDYHLLKVRYALSRFWELYPLERVIIETIVDNGMVGEHENDLNFLYQRLRSIQ